MKLITFDTEEIAVPKGKPYIRRLYADGYNTSFSSEEIEPPFSERHITEKIFEKIILREEQSGKYKEYYVNFEDASLVMPLLEGIVNNQTEGLQKKNNDLKIKVAKLNDLLDEYEEMWFIKVRNFVIKLLKHLRRRKK